MANIHPTAVVCGTAELGRNVSVGPFCVIESGVTVGDDCQLAARVVLKTGTRLGSGNQVGEGAVLGGAPQHLQAGRDLGPLHVGHHNLIRENVTLHRGLKPDQPTCLGDHNLLMVGAHVGHDCQLGNHVILANNVLLGGHVIVSDHVYAGGAAAVHQFCRIGRYAMVGGLARVTQDVPPFVMLDGATGKIVGLNRVGLRRGGFGGDQLAQLKAAYRLIYRSGMKWSDTLAALARDFTHGPAAEFHAFLAASQRGVVPERRTPRAATIPFPPAAEPANDALRKRA